MTPRSETSRNQGVERGDLEGQRSLVRKNLERLADSLAAEGMPRPALDGKLLRPLAAFLTVPETMHNKLDDRFWWGALAVEMVHEASLLHDDILDDAPERRGKPTLSATAGVGPALVLGDHILTSAYRAAMATGSQEFLGVFIRSTERTVAGEIAQERAQGQILPEETYRRNITGKSGELFRAAFSLPPTLLGVGSLEAVGRIGAHLGCLYQMVDDFLDYCPDADRGKMPLQDFRQKKWTWPLGLLHSFDFQMSEAQILERLFTRPGNGFGAPMEVGVNRMEEEIQSLLQELTGQGLETGPLSNLLSGWSDILRRSAEMEVEVLSASSRSFVVDPRQDPTANPLSPSAPFRLRTGIRDKSLRPNQESGGPADLEPSFPNPTSQGEKAQPSIEGHRIRDSLAAACASLDTPEARLAYFGLHARTFRFAARLFPSEALNDVAGVYAFCRFTDDLVDEAEGVEPSALESLLDSWLSLAREAFDGRPTGIALLDQVLGRAREAGVPFHYVEELVEGVRMDIRPRSYESLEELRVYSYRVASVVGGWLTEQFGIHDPQVLERAFALGHAMQLTNILRDVGEDLEMGRLYLPQDSLRRHGVDGDLLRAKASQGSLMFPGYRRLLEELMAEAELEYAAAFEAIPALPLFFQGPVAVAARAYRGIHSEIRRNDYNNLTRRAKTSVLAKLRLGAGALLDLTLLKLRGKGFGTPARAADLAVEKTQGAPV